MSNRYDKEVKGCFDELTDSIIKEDVQELADCFYSRDKGKLYGSANWTGVTHRQLLDCLAYMYIQGAEDNY